MTSHSVHQGQAREIELRRQEVLDAAYGKIPQRFVRKPPKRILPP